jgi:GGDEF domain-containing protein
MLDVEGLKWVNDNLGWAAGDALLRAVASAIREEDVVGYRLGGDEFVFEGEDRASIQAAVDRIGRRLGAAGIEAKLSHGTTRRLKGARVHAGVGRSLDEADAALNSAKKAGIAAGERAARGDRPRGLWEARVLPFFKRTEPRDLRFFLQAFREADPDFGKEKDSNPGGDIMSREWLIRNMR